MRAVGKVVDATAPAAVTAVINSITTAARRVAADGAVRHRQHTGIGDASSPSSEAVNVTRATPAGGIVADGAGRHHQSALVKDSAATARGRYGVDGCVGCRVTADGAVRHRQ